MAKQLSLKEILALPLHKQALVLEERRSIARLREIKQMAASLALLEPLQEQIKAAGHTINADSTAPVFGKRQTIQILPHFIYAEVALAKALLTVGFEIIDRNSGPFRTVVFKKGRLTIQVLMSEKHLEKVEHAVAAEAPQEPAGATV